MIRCSHWCLCFLALPCLFDVPCYEILLSVVLVTVTLLWHKVTTVMWSSMMSQFSDYRLSSQSQDPIKINRNVSFLRKKTSDSGI